MSVQGDLLSGIGPTAIDLFSGAGGLTLGLLKAGFRVRLCADISRSCALTHQRNFPHIPFINDDIAHLPSSAILDQAGLRRDELDLLIGGPPCQGFSILGRREIDDPRNGLFGQFMRIAFDLRPKVVVIENVPGLATLDGGSLLASIGEAFMRAGYTADCAELVAAQYGVPQMRWRMFFIGWRNDLGVRGGFPLPTHGASGIGDLVPNRTLTAAETAGFLTIADAISDLPPIGSGELGTAYRGRPRTAYQKMMRAGLRAELFNHYAPRLSALNLRRIEHLQPGDDWRDLPRELLPPGMQRALLKDHTRRYRRMSWDGVARSIITRFRDPKSGEYIHPEQKRTISIREAARIQSFPDAFEFMGGYSDQYDQVGNAVPPLLAEAVATEIRKGLEGAAPEHMPVKSRYKIVA
jgi:DNA (cytosine-5)-methyltransferase 1